MTGPHRRTETPMRRWDPFRPLDMAAALWSTAVAVPPVSTGAAAAYRTVFVTLRRLVVGRRVTVRADSGPVTLTVTRLESRLDVRGLSVGQVDDVRVWASDIHWQDSRFESASAVLCNVHVRPGAPATMVAAPVHLTLDVSTEALDDLFSSRIGGSGPLSPAGPSPPRRPSWVPRFAGAVGEDGVARVRFARRPGLGHVEIDAELDGSALVLTPRAVALRRRRWPLPLRTPAYRIRLPELPHGLRLTDVGFEPGLVRLSGTLPEWRVEFTRRHLEYLLEF